MLAPAIPDKNDPLFREKQAQYRKDLEEQRLHPERWGIARGDASEGADAEFPDDAE